MFFSAQKNKCCILDFHQDHNIYYRAKNSEIAWIGNLTIEGLMKL